MDMGNAPDPAATADAIRAFARKLSDASWRLDQAISAARKSDMGYRAVTGGHCTTQPANAIPDAADAALALLVQHRAYN